MHCKVPYRTYERRHASSWSRRVQTPQDVSDHVDDDDDDEEEEEMNDDVDSDGLPPVLTKAHAMLAAKRKVTLIVCCR